MSQPCVMTWICSTTKKDKLYTFLPFVQKGQKSRNESCRVLAFLSWIEQFLCDSWFAYIEWSTFTWSTSSWTIWWVRYIPKSLLKLLLSTHLFLWQIMAFYMLFIRMIELIVKARRRRIQEGRVHPLGHHHFLNLWGDFDADEDHDFGHLHSDHHWLSIPHLQHQTPCIDKTLIIIKTQYLIWSHS